MLLVTRHGPLWVFPATGLAGARGGGAQSGKVAGGARRPQPRKHRGILRLRSGGHRVTRPAQRASHRPHREHKRQHGYRATRRPRRRSTPHNTRDECIGPSSHTHQ